MGESEERPGVYLETTIVGHLISRPSRDELVAWRQSLTRQWWDVDRCRYRTFISPEVIAEAGKGDPSAAEERLRALSDIDMLDASAAIGDLAQRIQSELRIPDRARFDAAHLAYAVHYELDYLLTWNCAHLANGPRLRRLADFLQAESLWLPIVCTPAEMVL